MRRPRTARRPGRPEADAARRSVDRRPFYFGFGCALALGGLVWLALQPRPPIAPRGASRSPARATSAAAADDAGALRAAVARDGSDVTARLDLARDLILADDLAGAARQTAAVLRLSADHPRALTYRAMIDLAAGRGDAAIAALRRVVTATPGLFEAHRVLVLAYVTRGRKAEAEAVVADLSRRAPSEGRKLARILARISEGGPWERGGAGNASHPLGSTEADGAAPR